MKELLFCGDRGGLRGCRGSKVILPFSGLIARGFVSGINLTSDPPLTPSNKMWVTDHLGFCVAFRTDRPRPTHVTFATIVLSKGDRIFPFFVGRQVWKNGPYEPAICLSWVVRLVRSYKLNLSCWRSSQQWESLQGFLVMVLEIGEWGILSPCVSVLLSNVIQFWSKVIILIACSH